MLTLFTDGRSRDCEGMTRRSFIQAGTLGIGGLTLPGLLAAKAQAGQYSHGIKDKSVVVLFLGGGATHVETFDPKMTAPPEYRSMRGEVQSSVAGVTLGGDFPRMAARADKLAIVRSFAHGSSSHSVGKQKVMQADNAMKASYGAIYARVAGGTNQQSGLPNFTLVTPAAIDATKYRTRNSVGQALDPGTLGPSFSAFDPSAGGEVLANMRLRIPNDRLGERRTLLEQLDTIKRRAHGAWLDGADKFQQQAFDVVLGSAAQAFDLSKENPKLVDRYDTTRFKDAEAVALGFQMLMARKLCESGCGFVTVSMGGWDMHSKLGPAIMQRGGAVDVAVSAFIDDLEERGLTDKVLLVVTGDFGRTPRINKNAGRDHWGNLCTLALAGGGLNMGQVIGTSDRTVSVPASDPITVQNLAATVMHTLVDPTIIRLQSDVPQEVNRMLAAGQPIRQLV